LVGVFVGVFVGVDVGVTTITVLEAVLFVSSFSAITPFGSTPTVLTRLPAVLGVTLNVILNDEPADRETVLLATQLSAVPEIAQLIVPVGAGLPFVTISAPCG
jgi:hypothetical protein